MVKFKKIATAGATLTAAALALSACTGGGGGTQDAAESQLQEVLDRGHLIVGTGSNNVPWHFQGDDGELQGGDIAMGHILAESLFGDPDAVEFVQQSADSRVPNLLTNKVDIAFQFMTITPARAQQVAFTIPYYTEGVGLILPADGAYADVTELEEEIENGNTIRVAVLENVDAEDTAQSVLPGAEVLMFDSQANVYQAVESDRAEAGVVDSSSIQWLANREPDRWVDAGVTAHPQNYGGAVAPGDPIWLNYVNTVIEDAMTGATWESYAAMLDEYFGIQMDPPQVGIPQTYRAPGQAD